MCSTSVLWIATVAFGEFVYTAGNAGSCSKYVGCLTGFTGFDAFEHLVFGIAATLFIIWFSERFTRYSVLPEKIWKKVLVIIALVALLSVAWEIVECIHDAVRLDILHQPLRNIRLQINLLDQPTNLDTMGDLIASFVGSLVGVFVSQSTTVTDVPSGAQ